MYLTEEFSGLFMFPKLILFHRRLIVLMILFMAALTVLFLQGSHLMIAEGEERFEKARGRLQFTSYLPTFRGQIIDRKGRVLAKDVASHSVAFEWDVITGDRAISNARREAKKTVGVERWKAISPEERQDLLESFLPANEGELNVFWNEVAATGGVDRVELNSRLTFIQNQIQHLAEVVWARQEEAHIKRYGENVPFETTPIKEQRDPQVLFSAVDDETAMHFELLCETYPNMLRVMHSRSRIYPQSRTIGHHRSIHISIARSSIPRCRCSIRFHRRTHCWRCSARSLGRRCQTIAISN